MPEREVKFRGARPRLYVHLRPRFQLCLSFSGHGRKQKGPAKQAPRAK